jgi:hypothetical protein
MFSLRSVSSSRKLVHSVARQGRVSGRVSERVSEGVVQRCVSTQVARDLTGVSERVSSSGLVRLGGVLLATSSLATV